MLLAEFTKYRYMALETEIIDLEKVAKIVSVTNIDAIIGGLYDRLDKNLDPLTPSMAM